MHPSAIDTVCYYLSMIEALLIIAAIYFALISVASHTPRKDFQKLTINLDELLDSDGDEELGWYDWCEEFTCEMCDELILEGEAMVTIKHNGDSFLLCEYCVNPAL